jgi:hypothetical protein
MKRPVMLPIAALAALSLLAAAPQPKSNPGFEKLKSLVGDWTGKTDGGSPVTASYKLVSSGTALMETLHPSGEMEMVTLYHPDGERLMMTHYCAAGNQPRMQSEKSSADPKTLSFKFVDATNLSGPNDGHMIGLDVTFEDADHFTQKWNWTGEPPSKPEVLHFQRKK